MVSLLLGLSSLTVSWSTLLLSVVLSVAVPLALAQGLRREPLEGGWLANLAVTRTPVWLLALLVTLVLMFGFQGPQIVAQPGLSYFWRCRSCSRYTSMVA
ncbi:hypothetical protein MPNT_50145 [Candidatus Methylacidithermus pantelleriae]|uniref:Uncharacterized protein n=1 Tax=Candidatus Methylacidithermus pantelleriae TaxID=2744239 RepID=A0A8J2BVP7_9BACT|nr:hypothetical protein MPNT_50145 [Candidatus Methylacidithermus pantelleriae]